MIDYTIIILGGNQMENKPSGGEEREYIRI